MANMDNPAGRLRYWMDQFQSYPGRGETLVTAAGAILNLPDSVAGRIEVMRFGATLWDLCVEVRRETALLPEVLHPEMLLADFGQIERAVDDFTLARQHSVSNMLSVIDAAGYRCLEYLDTYLHGQRPQAWLDDDVRQSLLEQTTKLLNDVIGANDLDAEVRDFIILRLRDVETALRDVLLTGTRAVERATESLIGSAHRRPDLWDRVAKTKWARRIGLLAGGLCLALQSVGGLPALMPGDDAHPEITNVQVIVENLGSQDRPETSDQRHDDIVDAEIVEDPGGASAAG